MAKAQRVLSIEIGYSMTQVCEMDYQSKRPKVYGVFSMKTPEGVIQDGFAPAPMPPQSPKAAPAAAI